MPDTKRLCQVHQICSETLEALEYSRFGVLVSNGMDRQAARMFALLEAEHRQVLASEIGADAALLARLRREMDDDVDPLDFWCRLDPEDIPSDLDGRYFGGFR